MHTITYHIGKRIIHFYTNSPLTSQTPKAAIDGRMTGLHYA